MKTLVVYGSGWSLNELSEAEWENLRQYDSIGVNWSVFQQWVEPTYMLVGDIRHDKKEPKLGHTMDEAYEKYIEQANGSRYDKTTFLVRPYQKPHMGGCKQKMCEWEWDSVWSKNCVTTSFHWAVLNGYDSVIVVGVDLYDYRYFFLKQDQCRLYGMKQGEGWRTKTKVNGKHPALRKFTRWFEVCKTDLKIYCYNPRSLLLEMPGVLLAPGPITVVQIGANNGKRDPFRKEVKKNRWRTLFVEPIPKVFGALVDSYRDKPYFNNFTFENCAIAESDGERDFYVSRRQSRISALDQTTRKIQTEIEKDACDIIRVKTMSLPSLFKKYGITELDMLVVDTEGYDLRIFKAHDWVVRPKKIHYEHVHIDADACKGFLESKGYSVREKDNIDSIATRRDI